jgi:hypothetical protein
VAFNFFKRFFLRKLLIKKINIKINAIPRKYLIVKLKINVICLFYVF